MSNPERPKVGTIAWRVLTVPNAEQVCEFYKDVVGWESSPQEVGGYNDFNMNLAETGETVAGICHARGPNADLPPQWLVYIVVEDVDRSAGRCKELGGQVVVAPRTLGGGRFCVIRDPAGAVCAPDQS
jgi:predicted enzyme related to lactoylglutathione lyase